MQFALLIYQGSTPLPKTPEWAVLSPEEQGDIYASYQALNEAPGVAPGLPLGLPGQATTVRVEGGVPACSEGPYAASGEPLGGYLVLEAETLERAVEVAAMVPAARLGGAVEIRPVARYW
jgi:hypothetical protein